MREYSDADLAALTSGGVWVANAQVWDSQNQRQVAGTDVLNITGGEVRLSRRGKYRRQLVGLKVTDPDNRDDIRDWLDPRNGYDILVSAGWQRGTVLPLGVFRPDRSHIEESADRTAVYDLGTCWDWGWRISRAGFTSTVTISRGTSAGAGIRAILEHTVPTVLPYVLEHGASAELPRLTYRPGDDPWEAIREIATGNGLEVWFDADNAPRIEPAPTANGRADFSLENNSNDPVTASRLEARMSDWGNAVTVVGTSSFLLFAVGATVEDDDPTSPTYVKGRTGRHAIRVESNTVYSTEAATAAATAELDRLRGGATTFDWSMVPFAALEPGDRVEVVRPTLGVAERVVVDDITVPLTPAAASGSARLTGVVPL